MSDQVQSIVEAVRRLGTEQRRELAEALAALAFSQPDVPDGRKNLVQSIQGKYRHIPTSSESFIDRKKEEAILESRR